MPDSSPEHLPSCGARCVAACPVSPRRWTPPDGAPRPPRVRVLHGAPVLVEKRYPRPLWECIDDPDAVAWHRSAGCEVRYRNAEPRTLLGLPLPAMDGPAEHAQYNLGRWTSDDGVEARQLEQAIADATRHRRAKILETNDDKRIARVSTMVALAFPAVSGDVNGRARPSARMRELFAIVTGNALPDDAGGNWRDLPDGGAIYAWFVWGLALILFGRERDPVPEHAIGRMLLGASPRDVRPPFASAGHVLSVTASPLPGLGGGVCPWPQDDPRMRQRTWSKSHEMAVHATFHSSAHVRGEQAVNRALDARAATRRAALTGYEQTAVAILNDRKLNRDEKATALREVEAHRRGIMLSHLDDAPALQEATADVTTPELFRRAKAAQRRLTAAVERVSREGDVLAPQRQERPRRARPRPEVMPLRGRVASEMFG